jgi:hypothetical protein
MANSSNDPDNERSSDTYTRVNQRMIVLFPQRQNKFPRNKTECRQFCTVNQRAHREENVPLQNNRDAILFDHNHGGK